MTIPRRARGLALSCALAVVAACGSVQPAHPDGSADADADAARGDAPPPIDAGAEPGDAASAVDAPDPSPGHELTSSANQVRGATFTLDVELGHGWSQTSVDGATFHLESDPAIKP
jgi:hypothetical protein